MGLPVQIYDPTVHYHQVRDVWIGVWSENHGAQRLYARHGFEKVGEYEFKVGQTRDHEFILRRG